MWKKDEVKPQSVPQATITPSAPVAAPVSAPIAAPASGVVPTAPASLPVSARAAACVTQGIRIKGEITGKEDLFVDGTLEGKLDFGNASVTVGPNGTVKADMSAREVVVRGQVDGRIEGTERVQLWSSGRVTGEVRTERLAIEDGALLRGKVEAGKPQARSAEDRSKNAASSSNEKVRSNSAAVNSQRAVI
jgi:cytoskeletal protein CcmA (bactofilin family)